MAWCLGMFSLADRGEGSCILGVQIHDCIKLSPQNTLIA